MAYQDREYRRAAVEFDDLRHVPARSPAPSRRGREEFDVDIRVRERERERDAGDGLGFLGRRQEAGPVVLRPRDADPIDHHARERERDRSPPGGLRYRDDRSVRRGKSVSPPHHELEHERTRIIERERERDTYRSPSRVRRRSPSTTRRRSPSRTRRSPSPNRNVRYFDAPETEHIHTRIIERERDLRERVPSPSPSPPPAAPVIRGPVIEREVITHYTDVDHGIISARPRSPPAPARRREREHDVRESRETRETDIDISLSKGRAEVDIHRSASRTRSKSRERRSSRFFDDDILVRRDLGLKVEEPAPRRRAHSVGAPQDDDPEYITSRLDARGHMGEAHGGATQQWTIVDVPPGTERIRMDGVGGGGTDTTFSKYSGVRRTTFIPDRDRDRGEGSVVDGPTGSAGRTTKDHRLNISVYDRERDIEIDKSGDRRVSRSPAPPPPKEMWTEITKDLVVREAIEELGYEYEETDMFFYVMEYLRYDDVLHLTELSDDIRRSKRRARDSRYDQRDYYDDAERKYYDAPGRRQGGYRRDEGTHERIRDTEVIYDTRGPSRYR